MTVHQLYSTKGKAYELTTPEPTSIKPSAFVFAYAKSGSTLLDRMIRQYCGAKGLASFSLYGEAFQKGVRPQEINPDALKCFADSGVIYTGFRNYPGLFDLPLDNKKLILLVRDPRDMLVSLFFSMVKSHPELRDSGGRWSKEIEEIENKGLIDFVLERAFSYRMYHRRYQEVLKGREHKVYRYEDVIYNKREWLIDILTYLEIEVDESLVDAVVAKNDIIPKAEDDNQHIRQVHPGNYKKKLDPKTILRLNRRLQEFLQAHDYSDISPC